MKCDTCYWKVTGCKDDSGRECGYYYPNDFDEEFSAPEPEYEPNTDDAWGNAGYSVRTLIEDIKRNGVL